MSTIAISTSNNVSPFGGLTVTAAVERIQALIYNVTSGTQLRNSNLSGLTIRLTGVYPK